MRKIFNTLIFIFFVFYASASAYAQSTTESNGGFIVTHNSAQQNPGLLTNNIISISWVSFLQLPLWVQLTYISLSIFALVALLKIFPLISGRLKHVLDNQKTKDIFYSIQKKPGLTIAELSEEQKMNRGTLKYHLSQLLVNNKIVFIKNGKFSRLFHNKQPVMDRESIISRYLRKREEPEYIIYDHG